DSAGRLTDIAHFTTQHAPLTNYHYSYDQADRILQQTTDYNPTVPAFSAYAALNHSAVEDLDFDRAGQLRILDSNASGGDEVYLYDDNGNRDDLSGDITIGPYNRLMRDASYEYFYDDEGNLTRRNSRTTSAYTIYTWDHRNRLTAVEHFDANDVRQEELLYRYHADDQLIERQRFWRFQTFWLNGGTEHYIYQGDQRALTLNGIGLLKNRYTWEPGVDRLLVDEVFSSDQLDEALWAATDHLGSVNQLLDLAGDVVEHREYDSFGNLEAAYHADGTPKLLNLNQGEQLDGNIGFAGRVSDRHAKLNYHRARWYEPESGRFIGEDPALDGTNWYAYAGNDPINFRDPSGLSAQHPLDGFQSTLTHNTNFAGGSIVDFAGTSSAAGSPFNNAPISIGSPSFVNPGLASQITGSGSVNPSGLDIGLRAASGPSFNEIIFGGPVSNSVVHSASNSNSSVGTFSSLPANNSVLNQVFGDLLDQQRNAQSLDFHNSLINAELSGIAQAQVRHNNSFVGELNQIGDVGSSSAPIISDIRDFTELATGRDAFTGEALNGFQYATTVLGAALPFVSSKSLREVFSSVPARTTVGSTEAYRNNFDRVFGNAAASTPNTTVTQSVGSLRQAGRKDAHHVVQDAAVRDLPGYNSNVAPGVQLSGPSTAVGTPHYSATQVQRQSGGGTYAAERRIGFKALLKAGFSPENARRAIEEADEFFYGLGVLPNTRTAIPKNR
ncbi:MAG: RHS repeat-associated core domain-containing protein, partial [Bythopirellula sp.]